MALARVAIRGAREHAREHGSTRSYEMLEELNLKTRTRYLAKLRNPAVDDSHDTSHSTEASSH